MTHVSDGPLGPATTSTWRPPALAGRVERLWLSTGSVAVPRERVLPDGTVGVALALGDDHRLLEAGSSQRLPTASVSGVYSRAFVIEHPPRFDTLGIVLHPAGMYALAAQPLAALADRVVDLRAVLGADVDALVDRCRATTDVRTRFRLVAAWLAERFARARASHEAIAWAVATIERSGGTVAVRSLREETGLSKTRLVDGFREHVGVTPKLYARVVRLRRAIERLHRNDFTSLADLAVDVGYYDQAHMNADFRELGGLSPLEYLATRYAEGTGSTTRERAERRAALSRPPGFG